MVVRHPKSKTQALPIEMMERERIVNIDSGDILREYNWGVATNYFSIYTIVHVVTTRLACDAQLSISRLY